MINISESALSALLPHSVHELSSNALAHLRRIYPRGTRIESSNFDPIKFWRNGSHVASLNWQTFDKGMQINEAMFAGSEGWVLKPAHLLSLGQSMSGKLRITGEVIGVSSLPAPNGQSHFSAYIRAELLHSEGEESWHTKTLKVKDISPETGADILWKDQFSWTFDSDELAFIRLLVKEAEWGKDEVLGIFCARVDYLQQGWRLVRLLNCRGKNTGATLLIRFNFSVVA